jgi:hypothetical protein
MHVIIVIIIESKQELQVIDMLDTLVHSDKHQTIDYYTDMNIY